MKRLFLLAFAAAALASLQAAGPPTAPAAAAVDDLQDVLYVGQPYPVLLRLRLYLDGKPVFERWDAFMARLFGLLDRNSSGGLDRTEAARAPQAVQMQQLLMGNLFAAPQGRPVPGRGAPDMDADKDGRVSLDEFKDFYRKNGAGPVFLGASAPVYVPPGAAPGTTFTDALFDLLDADKDGKLSRAELGAAERALLRFDTDDNELVSTQELGASGVQGQVRRTQQELEVAVRLQRGGTAPAQPTNLLLVPRDDQGRRMTGKLAVVRDVITRYDKDKDGKLSREEIAFPREVFDRLDRNKDGKLNVLELARWASEKPAGEFTLFLGAATAVMAQPRRGQPAPRPASLDMRVDLEGVRITVVARPGQVRGTADRFVLEQFRALDKDKQGFLTRRQVEVGQQGFYLRGLFDLADQNGDNRMTEAELKAALAVTATGGSARVQLALTASGQGLFQALDANSDGQLSVREMRNGWRRLEAYDRDKDGAIARAEFPRQFLLSAGPGAAGGAVLPPVVFVDRPNQAGRPAAAARGPRWFHKMDRNSDGDVSRAEWLGTREDFDRIDADRDGLISLDEAEAFDAQTRKRAN